ncbi:hypothetical protein MGN70_010867 [Eutypa lata]|nr:hypothetical protein MGN70_010867 [Eutypa lata]
MAAPGPPPPVPISTLLPAPPEDLSAYFETPDIITRFNSHEGYFGRQIRILEHQYLMLPDSVQGYEPTPRLERLIEFVSQYGGPLMMNDSGHMHIFCAPINENTAKRAQGYEYITHSSIRTLGEHLGRGLTRTLRSRNMLFWWGSWDNLTGRECFNYNSGMLNMYQSIWQVILERRGVDFKITFTQFNKITRPATRKMEIKVYTRPELSKENKASFKSSSIFGVQYVLDQANVDKPVQFEFKPRK